MHSARLDLLMQASCAASGAELAASDTPHVLGNIGDGAVAGSAGQRGVAKGSRRCAVLAATLEGGGMRDMRTGGVYGSIA